MTSNPEVTPEQAVLASVWVQWTADGRNIRRWQRVPFAEGEEVTAVILTQAEAKSKVEIAEAVGALRWLRAFWEPGIDHDTQEVQHALAAADAALAKHSEKPDA